MLTVNGQPHDINVEKEFFPENKELGFDVTIQMKNGHTHFYANADEIHWGYKFLESYPPRIAIESDNIHNSGTTFEIDEVIRVDVVDATEKAEDFYIRTEGNLIEGYYDGNL